MIHLTANISMHTERGSVVVVNTSKTFYRVVVEADEVTIFGPGLEECYEIGVEGSPIPRDPDLSDEGRAALAVIHFEESNR